MFRAPRFIVCCFTLFTAFGVYSCSDDPNFSAEEITPIIMEDEPEAAIIPCDTTDFSYSGFLVPLINDHCITCHSGKDAFGGVQLDAYEGVKKVAEEGRLYGAISWRGGYEAMPQGEPKLPNCVLENVKAWIDEGMLNN